LGQTDADTAKSDDKTFKFRPQLYSSTTGTQRVKAKDIDLTRLEHGLSKFGWRLEAGEEWRRLWGEDTIEEKKLKIQSDLGSKKCRKESQGRRAGSLERADAADIEAFEDWTQEISDTRLAKIRHFFMNDVGLNKLPPVQVLKKMKQTAKACHCSPYETAAWIRWRETAKCLTTPEEEKESVEATKAQALTLSDKRLTQSNVPDSQKRIKEGRIPRPSWMGNARQHKKKVEDLQRRIELLYEAGIALVRQQELSQLEQ
jgi:hypothetical protein